MTANATGFDFSKFVPGFDFLKQMTQPRSMAPSLSSWIAPTLDPEEIGRRIQELKTVQFWLEQNATALKATIQALEVQQLTCTTLRDMNVGMADMAKSLQQAATSSQHPFAAADTATNENPAAHDDASTSTAPLDAAMAQAGQWWSSLFNTFEGIAQQAQEEVAQRQQEFAQAQQQAAQAVAESAAAVAQQATTAVSAVAPKAATASAKPRSAKKPAATAKKPRTATSKAAKPGM